VARHLATMSEMLEVYNEIDSGKQLTLADLPPFERVATDGLGPFLLPPTREP
jgi:hypothetical protein